MPRPRPRGGAPAPPLVEFHRRKYGPELLVDAAFVREMPTFLSHPGPHALGFHDILLVTCGRGVFYRDGDPSPVGRESCSSAARERSANGASAGSTVPASSSARSS